MPILCSPGTRGIAAAVVLGVGRAIGEAMAVMMVAGNVTNMPTSLFQSVRFLTTAVASEMSYSSGLQKQALFGLWMRYDGGNAQRVLSGETENLAGGMGAPLVLAISAAVLVLWGSDKWVASAIAIVWGFAFALVPVGWSTWITRSLADQAEKAGSIQVAVIQLANTCGAAVGGVALDHLGLTSPLVISGTLMLLTALLVAGKVKAK